MIAATLFAFALSAPTPLEQDPAYQLAKTMVGGRWEGTVEQGAKVTFRFHVEPATGLIVADGSVSAGPGRTMPIRSSLGWDPDAKQMYYLDQHGVDTVYFGHVTREKDTLVFDFRALSGDSGHYRSTETLGPNDYTAKMAVEKDGKWVDVGFHLHLHRTS
jgi:hypothetical protein